MEGLDDAVHGERKRKKDGGTLRVKFDNRRGSVMVVLWLVGCSWAISDGQGQLGPSPALSLSEALTQCEPAKGTTCSALPRLD